MIPDIQILNIHTDPFPSNPEPYEFLLMGDHTLATPFRVHDDNLRTQVKYQYEEWFQTKLQREPTPFYEELMILFQAGHIHGQLKLYCACAPEPCHVEIIKQILLTNYEENLPYRDYYVHGNEGSAPRAKTVLDILEEQLKRKKDQ